MEELIKTSLWFPHLGLFITMDGFFMNIPDLRYFSSELFSFCQDRSDQNVKFSLKVFQPFSPEPSPISHPEFLSVKIEAALMNLCWFFLCHPEVLSLISCRIFFSLQFQEKKKNQRFTRITIPADEIQIFMTAKSPLFLMGFILVSPSQE